MKKVWLLLFILVPLSSVRAINTYYSDYRDYKIGTEEVLDLDDTLKKDEYIVYNTAITREKDLGYVPENQCVNKIPNDTKTEYTIRALTSENNRWYQSVDIAEGLINKIYILPGVYLTIGEIYFYNAGNKMNVSYTDDSFSKLFDDEFSTYVRLIPNEIYVFTFDPIYTRDLSINFISTSKINGSIRFEYVDGTIVSRTINTNELDVISHEYAEELRPIVGSFYGNDQLSSYEKVPKILFHCTTYENIITGIYKREEDIKEDEQKIINDKKTLYNYYIRDKVKISDKQITKTNFDLKELITYSTVDNYTIENNIDYSKNGTYLVKFIFNDDFIVEKEVKVNITRNTSTTSTTSTTSRIITTEEEKSDSAEEVVTIETEKVDDIDNKIDEKFEDVTTLRKTTSRTKEEVVETTSGLKLKANKNSPTYNKEDDVIEVEPIKGVVQDNKCNCCKKNKIIIILSIIIILLVGAYIYVVIKSE